jgi:hypothetical protein
MPLADDHRSATLRGRGNNESASPWKWERRRKKKKKDSIRWGGEHGTKEYRSWIMDHGSWGYVIDISACAHGAYE